MPIYWFVRHGESQAQVSDWPGPDSDVPLSDVGRAQARALSLQLPALAIERALCSPFVRAVETATLVLAHTRHQPVKVDDLRERFAGDWLKLYQRSPEMRQQMARWDFQPPGGESVRQATRRGLAALAAHENGADTIIFSHGRIIAGLLTLIDGLDPRKTEIHAVPNCTLIERELAPGQFAFLLASLDGTP